jgi:oxygen-independent coproporphyrinogen-3 oxidase
MAELNLDIRHWMRPGTLQLGSLPPLSVYVHLPWCLKKCPYCDFNSHEWRGDDLADAENRYINALMADLDASLPLIWGRSVQTVFIGGGTPSLFSPQGIERLLAEMRARLRLVADAEITLEANPGTFEKDRFKAFRQAGVTRLSIGVQSFDDRFLKPLGRVHDAEQALAAVSEAARCFETFNIDLMYALPGQNMQDLARDLEQALSFSPPHLSVYHLTIEPNTVYAKFPPQGLPDEDLAYEMLDLITERTGQAGLGRYEVSAYARAGHRCEHNLNYWQFGDYLGLGAGAHGKLSFAHRIMRTVRWREPQRYMEGALGGQALSQADEVRRADLPFEFMLNALRLRDGFDLSMYTERTGLPISSVQQALIQAEQKGLVQIIGKQLRPTELGFDFLSELQALFLEYS